MTTRTILPLKDLHTDPALQCRALLTSAAVTDYAEQMKAGDTFPPLTIFKVNKRYLVADGHLRLMAAKEAGLKEFKCLVQTGTLRDAILFAVGCNALHGLHRTIADKHKAVATLLKDKEWGAWSDNEIAKRCHVSHPFVGALRKQIRAATCNVTSSPKPEPRTYAKLGKVLTMNTSRIGKRKAKPKTLTVSSTDISIPSRTLTITATEARPPAQTVDLSAVKQDRRKAFMAALVHLEEEIDDTIYSTLHESIPGADNILAGRLESLAAILTRNADKLRKRERVQVH